MATARNSSAKRMLLGTLQMMGGAVMLSFSAVCVKWAHVGPTMAGFYRMIFGGLLLLCAILVRKERLFHGSHHVKSVFVCRLLFALDLTLVKMGKGDFPISFPVSSICSRSTPAERRSLSSGG